MLLYLLFERFQFSCLWRPNNVVVVRTTCRAVVLVWNNLSLQRTHDLNQTKCSHFVWRFAIRQNSCIFNLVGLIESKTVYNKIWLLYIVFDRESGSRLLLHPSSGLESGDWRLERRSWRMGVETDEAVTTGAKRAREWCHVRTICARVPASARACEYPCVCYGTDSGLASRTGDQG